MSRKNYKIFLILIPIFICWMIACTSKSKSYPCPAYNKPRGMFDSTGNLIGGFKGKKNEKSGLIEKKRIKSIRDRKRAG